MMSEPKPITVCTIKAAGQLKTTFASLASFGHYQMYHLHFTSTAPFFLSSPPTKLNFESRTSRTTATTHLQEKAHGTRD